MLKNKIWKARESGLFLFIVVLCFVFELGLKDKWLKTPVFTISFFSVPSI